MNGPISLSLVLLAASCCAAQEYEPNWGGSFSRCDHPTELLGREHLDLGVKISTSNEVLATQFERALEFWTEVLDLRWHRTDSQDCSIQLVEGASDIFGSATGCACVAARAQYPDRPAFEGWIAFNPRLKLPERDVFLISVHEIGHLLGLPHNASGSSVMYFLNLDDSVSLDSVDLDALAIRHKLRAGVAGNSARVPVPVPTPTSKTATNGRISLHARLVPGLHLGFSLHKLY